MPLIETRRRFTGELDQQPLHIDYRTYRKVPPPPGQQDDDLMRPDSLTVRHNEKTNTFEGDQIESIDLPLGTLITVPLSFQVEISTTSLSFIVPPMGAEPATGPSKLHSFAVRTVRRTGIAPRGEEGQLTTYTTVKLHGEMDDGE